MEKGKTNAQDQRPRCERGNAVLVNNFIFPPPASRIPQRTTANRQSQTVMRTTSTASNIARPPTPKTKIPSREEGEEQQEEVEEEEKYPKPHIPITTRSISQQSPSKIPPKSPQTPLRRPAKPSFVTPKQAANGSIDLIAGNGEGEGGANGYRRAGWMENDRAQRVGGEERRGEERLKGQGEADLKTFMPPVSSRSTDRVRST